MNFNQIIKDNQQNIKKIIKIFTKEENEDLEQEVYVKVWQKQEQYQEEGKFSSWIGVVAKNLARDYLKSKHKKNEKNIVQNEDVINHIKDKTNTPELKLVVTERQKRISVAINSLKSKLKEVLIMYEIEGKSYEEISKQIKCPIGTVKSRLYNAKKELSMKLEDLM